MQSVRIGRMESGPHVLMLLYPHLIRLFLHVFFEKSFQFTVYFSKIIRACPTARVPAIAPSKAPTKKKMCVRTFRGVAFNLSKIWETSYSWQFVEFEELAVWRKYSRTNNRFSGVLCRCGVGRLYLICKERWTGVGGWGG